RHTRVVGPGRTRAGHDLIAGLLDPTAHPVAQVGVALHQQNHCAPTHPRSSRERRPLHFTASAGRMDLPSGLPLAGRCTHAKGGPVLHAVTMFVRYYLELALP